MTDLRAVLIEAGARAMHAQSQGARYDFDEMGKRIQDKWRAQSEATLDAFLDTLADRADEWETAAVDYEEGRYGAPFGGPEPLIAVLRGDT